MDDYDYIIIGAGLAGLYSAYLLKKKNPDVKLVILEKTNSIGGRILIKKFHGIDVLLGSGVGRKDKDHLLLNLLKDLGFNDIHEGISDHIYLNNTKFKFLKVKKVFKNVATNLNKTFSNFAKEILGETDYKKFINAAGFTDYEKADYYDVVNYYGMEDNIKSTKIFYIPWRQFIEKMVCFIGSKNIKLNCEVTSIDVNAPNKHVKDQFDKHVKYQFDKHDESSSSAKKVICAGTINTLRKLFPANDIYKEIKAQPFFRVYVKFADESIKTLKNKIKKTVVVGYPLQKILPIDSLKGIYMIAYTDNDYAKDLHNIMKNKTKQEFHIYLEKVVNNIINSHVKIEDSISYYWSVGTHYNKPLSNKYKDRYDFIEHAQRPFGMDKQVYVVGEVVALHQGWCEGALESVVNILK